MSSVSEINALIREYARRSEAHYRLGIIDIERIPVDNVRDFAWWSYGVECGLLKALKIVREQVGGGILEEVECERRTEADDAPGGSGG